MATPTPLTHSHQFGEAQAWNSLRRAIATSSGFQSWKQQTVEQESEDSKTNVDLTDLPAENADQLVTQYLRETLKTLAY